MIDIPTDMTNQLNRGEDTEEAVIQAIRIYPFRLNRTLKDCIESSLKSNKKSGFILIQY